MYMYMQLSDSQEQYSQLTMKKKEIEDHKKSLQAYLQKEVHTYIRVVAKDMCIHAVARGNTHVLQLSKTRNTEQ